MIEKLWKKLSDKILRPRSLYIKSAWTIRTASGKDLPFVAEMSRMAIDEGVFYSTVAHEDYKLFVCEIEKKLVGYIDSLVSMGVVHILRLYVKPAHRRKGIGTDIMEKTLDEFKNMGCHKARLDVFASNLGAIDFFTRLNFVQEGYLHEDKEKKDTIIMSRFLKK